MDATYQGHGVKFRYPSEWEVSEQQEGAQFSITVSSPATAFWTLSLFADCPEPDDVVEAVLDAFREEYDELDEYPADGRIGKRESLGRDIDFVCLDSLNSAAVRAFRVRQFTVMVLYQHTEAEREETGPLFEMMTRSLAIRAEKPGASDDD